MTATDRCVCPDCGASHKKRATPKTSPRRRALTAATDLKPSKCPRCHAPVIAGRIDAIEQTLDPRPLNELGATTIRCAGRPVAAVRGLRATLTDPHFTRWPPQPGTTWHATHDCQRPVPHELGDATVDRTRRKAVQIAQRPPY